MRSALIVHREHLRHMQQHGRLIQAPMVVPEDSVPVAVGQDWIVLASDSDILQPDIPPAQQNPVRLKHGYGYTGEDGA